MALSHVLAKFTRAVNGPAIDEPDGFLLWRQAKFLSLPIKVWADDCFDEALHRSLSRPAFIVARDFEFHASVHALLVL